MNEKSFTNWNSLSDKEISRYIGSFIKHHRVLQNKSQDDLATAAGISRSTLSLLERGENVTLISLIQVLRVLDKLSVLSIFQLREIISPLALAKLQKKTRKRVRRKSGTKESKEEVKW